MNRLMIYWWLFPLPCLEKTFFVVLFPLLIVCSQTGCKFKHKSQPTVALPVNKNTLEGEGDPVRAVTAPCTTTARCTSTPAEKGSHSAAKDTPSMDPGCDTPSSGAARGLYPSSRARHEAFQRRLEEIEYLFRQVWLGREVHLS